MAATSAHICQRKTSLLATCGSAALALGLLALPRAAQAEAFNAAPTIVQGTVTIDRTVSGQDTITVTGLDAVVDWQPTEISGTALTFLPNGNTAFFQGTPGATDFAIINRILPSTDGVSPIFDGRVVSRLMGATAPAGPGGTVMFYAASGLAIGPNAVFDVRRLFLSSLAPDIATFDDYLAGTGPLLFDGGSRPVVLSTGSQVNAPAEGSYFVVTAPEIQLLGDATINGSVAYIAGQGASLSYNAGLFDIAITQGTTASTAILHNGNTGGPSSLGAADPHMIYGVARGANDVIVLLFSGNLGFDPAASASVVNGEIILSANYNVAGASVVNDRTPSAVLSAALADITLDQATVTSNLTAHSSDYVQFSAFGGSSSVAGTLDLYGQQIAQINASDGGVITITGNVTVDATVQAPNIFNANLPAALDAEGGLALIDLQGGSITINGNATLTALGIAGADTGALFGGTGFGGTAEVISQGGTIRVDGNLTLDASGRGVTSPLLLTSGAGGEGGRASVLARGSSAALVDVGGALTVQAQGVAGSLLDTNIITPGDAVGGTAQVHAADGARIAVASGALLDTEAFGSNNAGSLGGRAQAGTVSLEALTGSRVTIGGNLLALANAQGGTASVGLGGAAVGGPVLATGTAGGLIEIIGAGAVFQSGAQGGAGNGGGAGTGGDVTFTFTNANLVAKGMIVQSAGSGGVATNDPAGIGTGGLVTIDLLIGSELSASGPVAFSSSGTGGNATGEGAGGSGIGGTLALTLDGGRLDSPNSAVSLTTGGRGGNGGPAGAASGGEIQINARNTALVNVDLFTANARAQGGNSGDDIGGSALGGIVTANVTTGSQFLSDTDARFQAEAVGGIGFGAAGGDATGSSAIVTVNAGTLRAANGTIELLATATGGAGSDALGRAGDASEIVARLETVGGAQVTSSVLQLTATATGGDSAQFEGGDASTALAELNVQGSSIVSVTGTGLTRPSITATVTGGTTRGGDGIGGTANTAEATLTLGGSSTLSFPTLAAAPTAQPLIASLARGGSSTVNNGAGGAATGGIATVTLADSAQLTAGALQVLGEARGGAGLAAGGNTTTGGAASGGAVSVNLTGTAQLATQLDAAAVTIGGAGTGTASGGAAGAANVTLSVTGGIATLAGTSTLLSNAVGGAGATGGAATSGQAAITLATGGQLVFTGATSVLNASSLAQGGAGITTGGNATSGTVTVSNDAARLNGQRLDLFADAIGGDNSGSTDAGDATGGTVFFRTSNTGTSTLALLSGRALATTNNGAAATGGTVQVVAQGIGSSLTAPTVTLAATPSYGATAASGTGGVFRVDAIDGGLLAFTDLTATVNDAFDPANAVEATTSRLQALGNGRITVTGFAALDTSGDLLFDTANGGLITGQAPPAAVTGSFFGTAAGQVLVNGDNPANAGLAGDIVSFTSRDVALNAGARVEASTLSFSSIETAAEAVLGGTTEGPGYTLTQAELDRVFAPTLIVSTDDTANTNVDLLVRDVTRRGSLDPQGTSSLTISTNGIMVIAGLVDYTLATSTNRLELFATESLRMDLPAGRVSFTNGGSIPTLAGTLVVSANTIYAANANLLPLLIATPTDPGLSALLNDSSSFSSPVNYLAANSVELEFGDYLLTQNTGPAGVLRGILVGPGGLRIRQNPDVTPHPARVITFGASANGSGVLTTNDAFFATVDYGNLPLADHYTADATLNNCSIVAQICGPLPPPPPPPPPPPSPPEREIDVPLTSRDLTEVPPPKITLAAVTQAATDAAFGVEFASALQVPEGDDQGLVTDPVTSGGDETAPLGEEDE